MHSVEPEMADHDIARNYAAISTGFFMQVTDSYAINMSVYFLINPTKTLELPCIVILTILSFTLLSTDFVSNANPI